LAEPSPRNKEADLRKKAESLPKIEISHPSREQLVGALGGERVIEILRGAERVEAVLLKMPPDPQTTPPHEYPVEGDSVVVKPAVALGFADWLVDSSRHLVAREGEAKGCFPIYYLRLRYSLGDSAVDVYVCFLCDDVTIYEEGKTVPYQGIDFAVDGSLHLALHIFPDDPALRQVADFRTKSTTTINPNAESRDPYADF
jgi:hypothetical protein